MTFQTAAEFATHKREYTMNTSRLLRQCLPEKVIIVLCSPLDPASDVLNVQDYVMGGETVVPLFSSWEALQQSTCGKDLARPVVEISRSLLTYVAHGSEVFLLDPQLETELRFTVSDLRSAFPEPLVLH